LNDSAVAKFSPDDGAPLAPDTLALCLAIEVLLDCASSCAQTRSANKKTDENTRKRDGINNLLGFTSDSLPKPYFAEMRGLGTTEVTFNGGKSLPSAERSEDPMMYSNQPGCFVKLFRAPPNSHKPSINRYWRGIRRVRRPRWRRKTRLRVSLNYVLPTSFRPTCSFRQS
jgi:hypothetical protein